MSCSKRLGRKLADGASPNGRAYRLGGDEFCALLELRGDPATLATALAETLLEAAEHFTIGASYGDVLLGAETRDADEALRIADQRLYAQKTLLDRPIGLEWRDVLLGLLRERDPELGTHVQEVADRARRLGERLGMGAEDLRNLVAAAELHDIGKAAIPEAILDKPSALDSEERAFMERHTVIGERIIASTPTGRPVAAIVRATHEHYDGGGYPDGLSGEQIPQAARIIAICDAYHAMRSDRTYRSAISRGRGDPESFAAAPATSSIPRSRRYSSSSWPTSRQRPARANPPAHTGSSPGSASGWRTSHHVTGSVPQERAGPLAR